MTKRIAILVVLAAACGKDNPYYCENNPEHNCAIDGGTSVDTPTTCVISDECTDVAMPACDTGTGQCVACTATDLGACTGAKPVCSSSNACRSCTANSECISGACMPDGSCASPSVLLFASPSGGATTCAAGDKCSLEQAMTMGNQKIVVLDPGTYTTSGTINVANEITLLGRNATIVKGGTGNPVLNVGTGGKLSVYYATIKNGDDNTLGHGIACMGGTVVAKLVTLKDNAASGLSASACDVTLDRSVVSGNMNGGVALAGASEPFTITNNFIYLNGSSTVAGVGGVKMGLNTPTASRLEFNTIVDNASKSGAANTGGVFCGATFTAANNIIAHNTLALSTAGQAQVFGDCTFPTSKVQVDITDLAFVNTASTPYDLRIGQSSTAKDFATTTSAIAVDFEGDDRPQNGQKDSGADEFK